MFFSRLRKENAQEKKGQQTPELPVLGKDSLGQPLRALQCALVDSQTYGAWVQTLETSDNVSRIGGAIGLGEKTRTLTTEMLQHVQVEVLPKKMWVPLDTLRSYSKEQWEHIAQLAKAIDKKTHAHIPNKEEIVELTRELKSIAYEYPEGSFITAFEEDNKEVTFKSYIPGDAISYFEIPKKDFSSDFFDGEYAWFVFHQADQEYIVPAYARLNANLPKAEVQRIERSLTDEELVTKLRQDFPWFTQDDLQRSHPTDSTMTSPFGNMGVVDRARLRKMYPHRSEGDYDSAYKEPTESEQTYLASRNYARLAEFAVMILQSPEATEFGRPKMEDVSPFERKRATSELIAEVEKGITRLNKARRELEVQLFGEAIPDSTLAFIDRFTSGDTLSFEVYGAYNNGLVNIVTLGIRNSAMYGSTMALPPEQRIQSFVDKLIDITSHENGHSSNYGESYGSKGNERLNPQWHEVEGHSSWEREEIWNEWKSVILPHKLLGEKPRAKSVYQYVPGTDQRGGAWLIEDMIADLNKKAQSGKRIDVPAYDPQGNEIGTQPLTFELIMKSALATALRRTERDPIPVGDECIIPFGELYDWAFGKYKNQYSLKMRDLTDADYNTGGRPGNDSTPQCTGQSELREKKLREQLKDHIHQEMLQQLQSRSFSVSNE